MNDRTRIKLRRGGHENTDAVTAEFVRRVIAETLEANGLDKHVEWRTGVEEQLQVLRVIANDIRSAVALSHTHAGSARVKLEELLEGMMTALVNVDGLMQPGDVGELSAQQQLLERAFDRFRPPGDAQNEAVETDDFVDPIESLFDESDEVDATPPTRRRRRRPVL